MIRLALLILPCLLSAAVVTAQQSTTGILAAILSDSRWQASQDFAARYRSADTRLPLLEELELRGRTRRFATMRNDVILRASFNSPAEKKAEQARHRSMADLKALGAMELQGSLLTLRYQQLLEAIHTDKQIALASARLDHLQNLDTLYRRILAAGQSTDLAKYLKNKEDIIQGELDLGALQEKRGQLYRSLALDHSDSIRTADLITPARMLGIVQSLQPRYETTLETRESEARFQALDADWRAQRARDHRILDFLEGRYTLRNDLFFEDRFSIGIGLTAPWRGSSRIKEQRTRLQQDELLTERLIGELQFLEAFRQERAGFEQRHALLVRYAEALNRAELQSLRDAIRQSGRLSLPDLERLHQAELEIQARQWDHQYELLRSFIRLLTITEDLIARPHRDYLHEWTPLVIR
jgi:hypothetical protein